MKARFYVIGVQHDQPWPLMLDARTMDGATRAINWQIKGGDSKPSDWRICWIEGGRMFDGDFTHDLKNYIYTQEAWDRFRAESGYEGDGK